MRATAIVPTFNRWTWMPSVIRCFLAQSFQDSELLIVNDGDDPSIGCVPDHPRVRYIKLDGPRRTIGEKRNICCDLAHGELIIHADDDDWSGPNRIAHQVAELDRSGKQVLGYHNILLFDQVRGRAHRYNQTNGQPLWAFAHGATFCYRREFWLGHEFENRSGKEDSFFAKAADKRGQFVSVDAGLNAVLRVHGNNAYPPPLDRIVCIGGREQIPEGFFA